MAVRVTDVEVIAIMDETESGDNLTPFILTANYIVNNQLSGEGFTEALLKEIERWVAAHCAAMKYRSPEQEKIGDASVKYGEGLGKYLDMTRYGQMAKTMDTSGKLSNVGKMPSKVTAVDFDVT